ncbi:MAG TPA: ParB/RepB/Spo0J family partition protein [Dehalococcoidia bacterium]|nr:ParB/RepB/Spo0J family partition protein [Dehalococcoidia bacterium]
MSAGKKPPIIRRSPIDNLFTSLEEEGVRPYRQVKSIALDRIDPNPLQPRRRYDEAALAELTESIRAHDLQNPINVYRVGDRYVIVSGHRRFEACRRLGRSEIPALVRTIDDQADGLVKALIENVQRSDLDPLDEARSYRDLVSLRGWSIREVARQVGKSPAHVQGRVSLLEDEVVAAAVERGMAARTAAEIARIDDPALRHQVLERAEAEKLNITEVVRQIRAARDPAAAELSVAPAGSPPDTPAAAAAATVETPTAADQPPADAAGPAPSADAAGLSAAQFRWLGRLESFHRAAATLRQELPPDLPDADRTRAVAKIRNAIMDLRALLNDLNAAAPSQP